MRYGQTQPDAGNRPVAALATAPLTAFARVRFVSAIAPLLALVASTIAAHAQCTGGPPTYTCAGTTGTAQTLNAATQAVTATVSGTFTTTGTAGVTGSGGNASIDAGALGVHDGILASTGGAGGVTIRSAGTITASGNGVNTTAVDGVTIIDNRGAP